MKLEAYEGRCHCGAIGFVFRTALPSGRWSIRACQCTFCRAHDARSTSDPQGELEFRARDPDLLQRYRFGGGTADFLLCRSCGVYVGAQMAAEGRTFGIINVHALDEDPLELPTAAPMSYDGESGDERRSRRMRRWTPVTRAA